MAPDGPLDQVSVPADVGRLAVIRLQLSEFRSYREAQIDVEPRSVVLTGANGAGKTNLLEAISFLAPGRGLRRAKLGEIDRRETGHSQGDEIRAASPWAVAATVATAQGAVRIGTGRETTPSGGERRAVRIDGASARSQTALAEHVNVVWLTPQMDRLFLEGAAARRRFLDRLVYGFDPAHAARCASYEQALRERSRLLREGSRDAAWLAALEDTMARHGVAIAAARREVTERLGRACADRGGAFPGARLAMAGAVDDWLAEMPALAAEERLRGCLQASRRIDGEAAEGPHRSDLRVRHGGSGAAAEQCSTGEQKALLIAILLAHARLQTALRGVAPIMLLDEVAAHLDRARRRALFAEIETLRVQAWLTGTEEELFAGLNGTAQFLTVRDAVVAAS
ncbi:MAG TPA: DNA replication/repair protein RecF [Stellaceae bacterium]|nr:DNA replication/repair protein RecF [Stellaceae bacterium]